MASAGAPADARCPAMLGATIPGHDVVMQVS